MIVPPSSARNRRVRNERTITLSIRRISLAAAAAAALVGGLAFAPSAQAEGQFCYDVDVQVNGEAVVDQAACEMLPEVPALP